MSWLLDLYETYERNKRFVGVLETKEKRQAYMLLPVSHTTQTAHIEVVVSPQGEFLHASVVPRDKSNTVIPASEEAASRSSNMAPYPLHDNLSYVSGDYKIYGSNRKKLNYYNAYIKNLCQWVESPLATKEVKSIYEYLKKGVLITDLISANILHLNPEGKLASKWAGEPKEKPAIFSVLAGDLESAFIRFDVYNPNEIKNKFWEDPKQFEKFQEYYANHMSQSEDICYVLGKKTTITEKHANKIRNSGDFAKLISAGEDRGFKYKGRFQTSRQAATLGYEVSQKAHNALKWLINRQGIFLEDRVVLAWGTEEVEDFVSLLSSGYEIQEYVETQEAFAKELKRTLMGTKGDLVTDAKIIILILDSATPGRMSVNYYRSIDKEDFIERIQKWNRIHSWRNQKPYSKEFFIGVPSLIEISKAVYGEQGSKKAIKQLVERMIPCIVDGRTIPVDIIKTLFQKASRPEAFEKWEWERVLSAACALINEEGGEGMSLDTTNTDRSYLFGRLLAVADRLESYALSSNQEERTTNAMRYMNAFSQTPTRTWGIIQKSLQPYQARLGKKASHYNRLIDEIGNQIRYEDFNNQPLTEKYLLGFYSQRYELTQRNVKQVENVKEEV